MIKIENVSFAYPRKRNNVHTNLTLNLEQNKIYGLLGKNGTGKSTLLYLISGLLKPTEGTITTETTDEETGETIVHSTFDRHQEVLRETFLVNEEYTLPPITLNEWSNSLGGFYPSYSDEMFRQCLADFDISSHSNTEYREVLWKESSIRNQHFKEMPQWHIARVQILRQISISNFSLTQQLMVSSSKTLLRNKSDIRALQRTD